jgi:hypothetical protein
MESPKYPITWKDAVSLCYMFRYKVICKFGYHKTTYYCFSKIFEKYGGVLRALNSMPSLRLVQYKTWLCENPKCKEVYEKCPFAPFKCINLERKNQCFKKWAIEYHIVKL